jgi:hypothetical protein
VTGAGAPRAGVADAELVAPGGALGAAPLAPEAVLVGGVNVAEEGGAFFGAVGATPAADAAGVGAAAVVEAGVVVDGVGAGAASGGAGVDGAGADASVAGVVVDDVSTGGGLVMVVVGRRNAMNASTPTPTTSSVSRIPAVARCGARRVTVASPLSVGAGRGVGMAARGATAEGVTGDWATPDAVLDGGTAAGATGMRASGGVSIGPIVSSASLDAALWTIGIFPVRPFSSAVRNSAAD